MRRAFLEGGNLARFEARALVVKATVEQFPAVDLAFAWTQDKYAPLILGHMNFFRIWSQQERGLIENECSPKPYSDTDA